MAPARQRLDRAGRRLMWLLAPATFFDGYDGLILGLALPSIRRSFGLSLAEAGVMVSIILAGSYGSLVLLALADRWGRRPTLTLTIGGYTIFTFLTAFSQGVVDFTIYQFVARIFLGAEKPLASIVVVEAIPDRRRGRSLGLLSSMVAFGQAGAGLGFFLTDLTGASWRLLYLVGIVPLLLIARARRDLPETRRAILPERVPIRDLRRRVRARWVAGVAALAFLFSVMPTAVTSFASSLVIDEWQWKLADINAIYVTLWVLGISGFFVAGRLLDSWGRRPTTIVFLTLATVAGFIAFPAETDVVRAVGLALVIFGLTGSTPGMSAFGAEPFPALYRGRVGAVVRLFDIAGGAAAPLIVGLLAEPLGLGPAMALAGVSYVLGAGVVATLLPETRPAVGGATPEPGAV